MQDIHQQAVRKILRYIKRNNIDGIVQESMALIGKNTGYSNATVFRSIRALEKEGYIRIIKTQSKKVPNKIFYIGPEYDEVTNMMEEAEVAMKELRQATDRVNQLLRDLSQIMDLYPIEEQEYIQLH